MLVHNKGPDDGPNGSIDNSPYYISHYNHTETFNKWTKKLAVHTGVPTWKEPVDASQANDPNVVQVSENDYVKIHFGDVDYGCRPGEVSSSFDWYFFGDDQNLPTGWANPFTNMFDFFTNNLSGSGMTTYDWPFYYNPNAKFKSVDVDENTKQITKQAFRGVLTNMWAGCEPVCAILSKLLKNGFFCSYPWNVGLGYMFRKKPIPKLVFVFSNEFDNSFTANYNYTDGYSFQTPLIIAGINKTQVAFHPIKDARGKYRDALDPYCVKQLKTDGTQESADLLKRRFDDYLDNIRISSGIDRQNLSNAIYNLIVSDNLSNISQLGDDSTSRADTLWKLGEQVTDSLGITYTGYSASMDLDSNPTPFKGMNVTELLTQSQLDAVKDTMHFPGIKYTTGKADKDGYAKSQYEWCNYWAPKTVGFYQLRNTFCRLADTFNTYMFVSDANAPTPIYDVAIDPENIGLDNWWEDVDNARAVAYSLMLEQDSSLFDDIGKISLPQEVGEAFYKCRHGKEWEPGKPLPTYNDLLKSNIDYFYDTGNKSAKQYK